MMDGNINDTGNQFYIILIQSFCKRSLNEDKISCENCQVVQTSSNRKIYELKINYIILGDTGTLICYIICNT